MLSSYTPTVLSIAGSDTYGGAGIQVDAKTIHTLGAYAFTAITALTAQNSTGVKAVSNTSKEMFKQQLESILDDVQVDAVKIGMLGNVDIILEVINAIDKYKLKNIVLDTVLVSSSGKSLLDPSAIETMIKELFPRVDLITPNIPEVNMLLGMNYMGNEDEVNAMANALFGLGANAVLIKGGHSANKEKATDYLAEKPLVKKPLDVKAYSTPRITTTHTHGTGCVLSSAIASHLALGYDLTKSVELSKIFLYKSLQASSSLIFKYRKEENERKEPIL
jgi:hydroxymethylpyrimidine/phosphomethylpyrimidine kinase